MTKKIKEQYKAVIKDLRSQMNKPCEDKSPICANCTVHRVANDLEYLFEMFKDL